MSTPALTVKVKLVVRVVDPALALTVIALLPVGVDDRVLMVMSVVQPGEQDVGANDAVAPVGSPVAEKVTGTETPDVRVAVMAFAACVPRTTEMLPP
jgi:hypothetical protein